MNHRQAGIDRRRFLAVSGAAAAAVSSGLSATAARRGIGEKYSLIPCPWTAENPRHDHQLIFPLSGDRLLLVWCEYYVKKPSRIFRSPYSAAGSGDAAPCRISARVSKDRGRTWSGKVTLQENFGVDNVKHPNLLRLPSGEILFSFTVRDIANRDLKIYLKRSRDECETWTEPVQISPTGGVYFTNADHNLLHSSGRIILPCHWVSSMAVGIITTHFASTLMTKERRGKRAVRESIFPSAAPRSRVWPSSRTARCWR